MTHHTKDKGDLATIEAMSDLTRQGYAILSPVVTEHLPFDFIAYKDSISFRVQAKYSSNGFISKKTSWNDKHGNHKKLYDANDFDYYAIYLPDINRVVYPHIDFRGCTISSKMRNSATPFYWWEDFITFTKNTKKKTYKDFGYKLINIGHQNIADYNTARKITPNISIAKQEKIIFTTAGGWNRGMEFPETHKVIHPSKEELEKLLWEKPTTQIAEQFGVSDNAVAKWAKSYGLTKPPRGYWTKLKVGQNLVTLEGIAPPANWVETNRSIC